MTILARPMFNMPRRMASGGGASFPDLSGDGQVTRKDILMGRGVVQKANGGGIASMMDPAMMGMAPPPMDPMMAQDLNAMENQGMALGQDLVVNAEMGIDAAENPQQVIDALRGNQLPLQARYDELATFVGPEDAAITPTSVLALTQPAIIMANEGEVDQGVGGLMQGMTGDVMMENEMGMGVGELMAGPAPQPVPMNKGGAVPKLQLGSTDQETAPRRFNLESETNKTFGELEKLAGLTENEKRLQDLAIYSSLFDRFVGLAANKDPRTGENLEGNTLGNIAQVAGGFLGDVAKAKGPELTRSGKLRDFSLQDTLARRTMQEKAGYDLQAAEVAAGLRGVNTNQMRSVLVSPDYAPLVEAYKTGLPLTESEIRLVEGAVDANQRYNTVLDPLSGNQIDRPLPNPYRYILEERAAALSGDETEKPDDDKSSETYENQFRVDLEAQERVDDYFEKVVKDAPEIFGTGGVIKGTIDDFRTLIGAPSTAGASRDNALAYVQRLNKDLLFDIKETNALGDRGQYILDELRKGIPNPQEFLTSPERAADQYLNLLSNLLELKKSTEDLMQTPYLNQDAKAMQDAKLFIDRTSNNIKRVNELVSVLQTGSQSSGATRSQMNDLLNTPLNNEGL
tara:strand:- start:1278 stop:3158 length:1881 start_codon:yes stop_codon:yes gene_type:complete